MTKPISHVECCDNMLMMSRYPDKFFDLAIIDPPYRDIKDNQPTKDMRSNGKMDCFGNKPTIAFYNELKRVSKKQIIWGANNFQFEIYKGFIVWKKQTIGETFTMSMCEIASLSENISTTSKWIELPPQDKNRIHPTQKPVKLYSWILKHYGKPGDKILDTYLGSQSSRIAAYKLGFDFYGCEIDEDYFREGCARFDSECKGIIKQENGIELIQQTLF